MIPYTTLDSIIAQMPERTGHTLLDENQRKDLFCGRQLVRHHHSI